MSRIVFQNYDEIRRTCLARNRLFVDRAFSYSRNFEWKRPAEIAKKPKYIIDGLSSFDIQQGIIGVRFLGTVIVSLTKTRYTQLLYKVIPTKDQKYFDGPQYAGIFKFSFWCLGEWVDVVIDDMLPTQNGRLVCSHSSNENEFWSPLLEKAYAKFNGGYESLKNSTSTEVLTAFTGGIVEHVELSEAPTNLFSQLKRSIARRSLVISSIKASSERDVGKRLGTGLVQGCVYAVKIVAPVRGANSTINLICIRSVSTQSEWNGDWSINCSRNHDTFVRNLNLSLKVSVMAYDKEINTFHALNIKISTAWRPISQKDKGIFNIEPNSGEFCMSFDDFKKHFTDVTICSISENELASDDTVLSWNTTVIDGTWDDRQTAGGSPSFPSFTSNPQYAIDLEKDADGDGKCSILIALRQKDSEHSIGFSIYKATSTAMRSISRSQVNSSVETSGSLSNGREVIKRFELDPGRYFVIPYTSRPREEGDFLLRISTEWNATQNSTADGTDTSMSIFRKAFDRIAGIDSKISADELQDMMTVYYKNMGGVTFSLEACRFMIPMLDDDGTGTLNFDEFCKIMESIRHWKRLFFQFGSGGTVKLSELRKCLSFLGYDFSSTAVQILFNRFATRRQYMNLDDFVACLCRAKMMNDVFIKKSSGSDRITSSKDEFFEITFNA